jgi:transcriptional regulator with XRE-family HTH domain
MDTRFIDLLRLARALVPGGLSQAGLARRSGIHFAKLSRLERGLQLPSDAEARCLAQVLGRPELRQLAAEVRQAAAAGEEAGR